LTLNLGCDLRPGRRGPYSTAVGWVNGDGVQAHRVLYDCDVLLDVLRASGRILDVLEDFAHPRLSQDFADKCDGGSQVWLDYVPWYLIVTTFVYRLRLIAYFFQICGVFVDVFGAIVYLWPTRCHHHRLTRFSRVIGDQTPRYG
jgi:hypothetical protein